MDVYERIDHVLKEKHMSRRQLALAAGIPESSLAAAFARRSRMTSENLWKIANVLQVQPSDLGFHLDLSPRRLNPDNPEDQQALINSADLDREFVRVRNAYFHLNDTGGELLAEIAETLAEMPRYQHDKYVRPDGTVATKDH